MITHCKNLNNNQREKPFFSWSSRSDWERMVMILSSDGIIAGTSDTVVGLLASATPTGKARLDAIKQRSGKPYLLLVTTQIMQDILKHHKCFHIENILKSIWPGPLTVISSVPGFAAVAYSLSGEVAIRVPDHAGLLYLASRVGPLFSTSANLSGEPVPSTVSAISGPVRERVDAFVDDTDSGYAELTASTIIRLTQEGYQLVRQGSITVAQLNQVLGT